MKVNRFPDLAAARSEYLQRVDELAGHIRARHITIVPGQSATYESKRVDAERFETNGSPDDPVAYPWVAAEAEAQGATLAVAAAVILQNRDAWQQAGAVIERERMRAKYQIYAVATIREMHDALVYAEGVMEAVSATLSAQGG